MKTCARNRLHPPATVRVCLCVLLLLASSSRSLAQLPAEPAGDQASLLMPLAAESLLLDVSCAGKRLVAVGERGHILLSDDQGLSWRQVRTPTRQMLTAVSFASPRRGWAVGHDGLILASVDGGESWTLQRQGLLAQRHITRRRLASLLEQQQQLKARLLEAETADLRSGLQRQLEDLALDVEDLELNLTEPVHAPPLLDVFFMDELRGIAVGAFNTLLLTADGGVSWDDGSERLANSDELHLNAVTGDRQGQLWIAAEGGLLFRSLDSGVEWQSLPSPHPASWFGIAREPRQGVLLVFGLQGKVFRSLDDGVSWQPASSDSQRSLYGGVFLKDRSALLAGAVGTLLLSSDGGASFTAQSLPERVNLSSVAAACGEIVVVGQGGVYHPAGLGEIQ